MPISIKGIPKYCITSQTISEAVTKVVATAIADALAVIEDGEASASTKVDTSTKVDEKSKVKSKTVDTPKGKEWDFEYHCFLK